MGQLVSDALDPTPVEYIKALREAVRTAKRRPSSIAVDCKAAVLPLRQLLKDTDLKVGYYPPPSPEEEELNDATNPHGRNLLPRCAVCRRYHCSDGTALLRCSACKDEFYCSKEHQLQGWKTHKVLCRLKKKMAI